MRQDPFAASRDRNHRQARQFITEVIVTITKEILEIPAALRQMCEEGRHVYDVLVRRASWGERPIFIVADGGAYPAALTAAWAFESLLGMPALIQRPDHFSAYTSRALASRSLVIIMETAGGQEETLAAARKAKGRRAMVWAVTPDPAGELAGLADAIINDYAAESAADSARAIFCRHAAMVFVAVAAAKVLKAPFAALSAQEEELEKLGQEAEWVITRIPDAALALAREAAAFHAFYIVGCGAFYPIALQAAERLARATGPAIRGTELTEFQKVMSAISEPGSGVLYLSSSRCGLKTQVHGSASDARQNGRLRILAVTDRNDRQLSERADLAVLLPILTEAGAALLTLLLLEMTASNAVRASRPTAQTARARKP
jgi:fructoselysine-6-P-deglycase FrlB-like protein